jgi:hypothetical protein
LKKFGQFGNFSCCLIILGRIYRVEKSQNIILWKIPDAGKKNQAVLGQI